MTTVLNPRIREGWRRFRRDPRRGDSGMTLVELVVVLLVLSIVMTLTTLLVVNVDNQTGDVLLTNSGVQSATLAEANLVQYFRAASQLLVAYNKAGAQISPSATEVDAIVNDGFSANPSTTANNFGATKTYESNCTNLDAMWYMPNSSSTSSKTSNAQLAVTFDVARTGPPNIAPWSTGELPGASVPENGTGPYVFTPSSSCSPPSSPGPRTIQPYFASPTQSLTVDPVFTYWGWSNQNLSVGTTTTAPTSNIPTGLEQLPLTTGGSPGAPNTLPLCAIPYVAAVGIHVTFLAGPTTPKRGYIGVQPTTINTLVFLRGNSTTGATTSSTSTTTTTPGTICTA